MQNKGQVIIHVDGKYGAEPLTPENYDIVLMRDVLDYAFDLLDLEKKIHKEYAQASKEFTAKAKAYFDKFKKEDEEVYQHPPEHLED